jgi:hypothetical protein
MAATKAVKPATRPPVKSVPARMIQPATPSAIGRRAAVREMMLMREAGLRKASRCVWTYSASSTMTIIMA